MQSSIIFCHWPEDKLSVPASSNFSHPDDSLSNVYILHALCRHSPTPIIQNILRRVITCQSSQNLATELVICPEVTENLISSQTLDKNGLVVRQGFTPPAHLIPLTNVCANSVDATAQPQRAFFFTMCGKQATTSPLSTLAD